VRRDADERSAVVGRDIERHERRIKTLTDNQARLVQLAYRGLVSDEVLAHEQDRLEAEKQKATRLLDQARLHASDVESTLDDPLAKTTTPHATYLASNPLERRLLNQAYFKRLLIGDDNEVVGATLTPVYAALAGPKCTDPAFDAQVTTVATAAATAFEAKLRESSLEPAARWKRVECDRPCGWLPPAEAKEARRSCCWRQAGTASWARCDPLHSRDGSPRPSSASKEQHGVGACAGRRGETCRAVFNCGGS
jgi:hypothetical protein